MKNKLKFPRRTVNIVIILATLLAAVYYFYHHKYLLKSLSHLPPYVIILVFLLYTLMLGVLVVIFDATMRLVNTKMPYKDNLLINAYSLFMNFFIPGQTGPIFRGYYMKKNYGLKYLNYIVATLIYYLVYAMISVIFIVAGSQAYYVSIPIALAVILGSIFAARFYIKRKHALLNLSTNNLIFLLVATLGQVVLQTLIYLIELRSVNHSVSLHQAITYTGTANLALFAALTPGAIGVREAFLLLTQKLHHISPSDIVLANVIDRSVYIVFLLILGVFIGLLKVKDKLNMPKNIQNVEI